jgi:hypothetical protein
LTIGGAPEMSGSHEIVEKHFAGALPKAEQARRLRERE